MNNKQILHAGDICLYRVEGSAACFCKLSRKWIDSNIWYATVILSFSEQCHLGRLETFASSCLEKYDIVKLAQLRMCIDNLIHDIIKEQTDEQ